MYFLPMYIFTNMTMLGLQKQKERTIIQTDNVLSFAKNHSASTGCCSMMMPDSCLRCLIK